MGAETRLARSDQMNRPFGAVDVSANLKGAVPKTATQKILATLADKGEITQKPYGLIFPTIYYCRLTLFLNVMKGKTVFYVAKQAEIEDVPAEKLTELEQEVKKMSEENKQLAEDVKKLNSGLSRMWREHEKAG